MTFSAFGLGLSSINGAVGDPRGLGVFSRGSVQTMPQDEEPMWPCSM